MMIYSIEAGDYEDRYVVITFTELEEAERYVTACRGIDRYDDELHIIPRKVYDKCDLECETVHRCLYIDISMRPWSVFNWKMLYDTEPFVYKLVDRNPVSSIISVYLPIDHTIFDPKEVRQIAENVINKYREEKGL